MVNINLLIHSRPLNNEQMLDLLLDKEIIPCLEKLLDKELQLLRKLVPLNKQDKLNFGLRLTELELLDLALLVEEEVRQFLHVNATGCGYGFGTPGDEGYMPLHRFVEIEDVPRAKLIPRIAHEYTHHVQNEKGLLWTIKPGVLVRDKSDNYILESFTEGHAKGVGRFVAKTYNEREVNDAFIRDVNWRTVASLRSTYAWVTKQLGLVPDDSLIQPPTFGFSILRGDKPCPHYVGNTVFYVAETLHDARIYVAVLNRR